MVVAIIAFFVGSIFGFFIGALMNAASNADTIYESNNSTRKD